MLLTFINTRSIQVGKLVQNVFTMLIRLSHLAQDAHVAHLLGIWTKCANPISMVFTSAKVLSFIALILISLIFAS